MGCIARTIARRNKLRGDGDADAGPERQVLLIVGLMPPAANPFGSGRSFLLEWLPKGAVGAEIGVWRGEFSKSLLRAAEPRELHLVDPWKFVPSFPSRWYGGMEAKSQADMDAIFAEVQDQFRTNPAVHILRKPSLECGRGLSQWKIRLGVH